MHLDDVPEELNNRYCCAWVASAIIGGSVIGGLGSAYAANKAANAQKQAAQNAANIAQNQYNTTRGDLSRYRDLGGQASDEMSRQLPFLTSPIVMDQATLEKTPGYQFNLTQGLKATQNSAAARGLGTSGAALKGAATYATGLADSTYQNQFNNENTNRTNAYNRLMGLIGTGENAAAMTGTIGQQAAGTAASATMAGGNATAAGINAIGSAVGNFGNNIAGYGLYKGLYGNSNNYASASGLDNGAFRNS